jgi:chromosome segregation ATPase
VIVIFHYCSAAHSRMTYGLDQVRRLQREKSRLEATLADSQRGFSEKLDLVARPNARADVDTPLRDISVVEMQKKIARLEAALELAERSLTRSAAEAVQVKEKEIDALRTKVSDLQLQLQQRGLAMPALPHFRSPGSADTITLVESDLDSGGSDQHQLAGGPSKTEHMRLKRVMDDLQASLAREQALETRLQASQVAEQKLRLQLARLERIQTSAQSCVLAQEEKLQQAVDQLGRTNETMDQMTVRLSEELRQWQARADRSSREASDLRRRVEQMQQEICDYDAAVSDLEQDLNECKQKLRIYHDRIVSLSGPEDKVIRDQITMEGKVPMSVHLRTTGKLGQQHAAEINHLQRSMEMQENALEKVRQELAQIQAAKAAADLQYQIHARQSSETIRYYYLYQSVFNVVEIPN